MPGVVQHSISMERTPVSVCLATYNGARFISEQVTSILQQLQQHDELIVSDDHSTDDTVAIIQAFNDPRITILQHKRPRNLISNFANALSCAKHDQIFLADQDDVWAADKVDTVSAMLDHYDLVVTDCTLIDENGTLLETSFFKSHGSKQGFLNNLIRNSYLGCCMAFRRSILERALPFPERIPMHDIWLGMLAEWYGKPCFHPKQLVAYRRHGSAVSTTGTDSRYSLWRKIAFRYNLLYCLLRRVLEHKSWP